MFDMSMVQDLENGQELGIAWLFVCRNGLIVRWFHCKKWTWLNCVDECSSVALAGSSAGSIFRFWTRLNHGCVVGFGLGEMEQLVAKTVECLGCFIAGLQVLNLTELEWI